MLRLCDSSAPIAHTGDKGRGRWVSVKQQVLFVDCLFDHNCEKVSVAVSVGKMRGGSEQGVYLYVYLCLTLRFEGRGDKYQWKT